MTEIIFATGNKDKMREIREIMADCDVHIVSMKEAGIRVDIVEDGTTFEENAKIKARAVAAHTDAIVLADDSGLEIDALNKEPGVYSARYMGEDTSYDVKNKNLIDRLDGVPKEKRTARFVCAIAAVLPDGRELVTRQSFDSFITSLKMDSRFYRCNRGVVINLEHAVDFDGTGFRLDNGSNVPVSRKLLKNARQTFMEFLFQRRS